jgi:hypothetical protein
MNKKEESERGFRAETGEIYMLNKKERILTIGVIKRTLSSEAGRKFVVERFGKEGLDTAVGLLEEMGVQVKRRPGQRSAPVS